MNEVKIRKLFEPETIRQKVVSLGERLQRDHEGRDPLLISLVGGSVIFLSDLVRSITRPVRFDFIQVHFSASAHDETILEIQYPISLDLEGQDLVILKDVSASGVIENYLGTQFLQRGARQVRFVALIDVPEDRRTDFKSDYQVFTAPRSGTFVGYGLKYKGLYGNLPYIGVVTEG